MSRPEWTSSSDSKLEPILDPKLGRLGIPEGFALRVVFLCSEALPQPQKSEGVHCHRLPIDAALPDYGFVEAAVQAAEILRDLLKREGQQQVLVQAVTLAGQEQCSAGIAALLRTLSLENPKFRSQHIEVEVGESPLSLLHKLEENLADLGEASVRYRDGVREVKSWEPVLEPASAPMPWKQQGGVYLITGGAGGLGLIFAESIASAVDAPVLILAGRSALDSARKERLDKLTALGARVEYRQADVSHADEAQSLIDAILSEHTHLHGVVHAAGVLQDNYLLNKSTDEVRTVLAPKVAGTVYLDQATQALALDFFVVFSSIAGAMGNPGQADYAMGNAFMDAFADQRNVQVANGQRCGRTLSINWPLWRDGGMGVDATTEILMRQHTGLEVLETQDGLQAFSDCLASGLGQVMVAVGRESHLLAQLQPHQGYLLQNERSQDEPLANRSIKVKGTEPLDPVHGALDTGELKEGIVERLKELFGDTVRMPVEDIAATEPLESYGIDSIVITHLNHQLSEIFGALSKTLFYEYQTLAALAEYLISDFPEICARWTGAQVSNAPLPVEVIEPQALNTPQSDARKDQVDPAVGLVSDTSSRGRQTSTRPQNPVERKPVAIIGISGRYPQARNLSEFWANLKAGKDCIAEIPADRWSIDEYFHPDPTEAVAQRKSYGKWGGFLEGFADFDPLFFNMSPREAINVDPQERLFLECCWELFEDAGYSKDEIAARHQGRVGVFAGITKTGFDLYGPPLWEQGEQVYPHTSFGSVANRISYLFDLHGPSMPIDTMCSSSLFALHEACEHLQRGECEMAVAGGVNLYLHPSSYVSLSVQQMLSKDGRCRSFGAGGDGFVPGEGVGMVLLKPLSRALADGDAIYGIVRGTSINHGGKTNGYTVPNPKAQAELVHKALVAANVDARHVSYLEAHGTGTALGDPIEITGLTQAFRKDTDDSQFCAIGSAKSNIGHLEAAAGIAGLTKVLLQLKHRQLVPSLHAQELNPNIDFSASPFLVQQDLADWEPSVDGQAIPRIAGISSFGAGGANAHAVIEEYLQESPDQAARYRVPESTPALILLSAADPERLKVYAQRLLDYLHEARGAHLPEPDLYDIAFTLQVGRQAMAHRLAFIAHSLDELLNNLQGFITGESAVTLYQGEAKPSDDTLQALANDDDMGTVIDAWLRKRKLAKLLKLWVKGLQFDWYRLYGETKPRRTRLPGYPFARQRYWMPERYPLKTTIGSGSNALHPLVHENISDFEQQCFRSHFTGQEFFLADHVIQGHKILPGVAYLEMARVAGELAGGQAVVCLENVVWAQPLRMGQEPLATLIRLQLDEHACHFEVCSEDGDDSQAPVIHAQGRLRWDEAAASETPAAYDITAIRGRCSEHRSGQEMVQGLQATGLGRAGASFHAMTDLWFKQTEALAQLNLPNCVLTGSEDYQLHPSMMDVAFEAVQFLLAQGEEQPLVRLPFALRRLRIHGDIPQQAFAYARPAAEQQGDERVARYDIDILDESGQVRVAFEGYTSIAAGNAQEAETQADLVCATPIWRPTAWPSPEKDSAITPQFLLSESMRDWEASLRRHWPKASVDYLSKDQFSNDKWSKNNSADEKQSTTSFIADLRRLAERLQNTMSDTAPRPLLLLMSVDDDPAQTSACAALLKSASREQTKLWAKLIECDSPRTNDRLIKGLEAELATQDQDVQLRFADNKRYVRAVEEVQLAPTKQTQNAGVIWITGGMGGLGAIFARHFSAVPGVKLVLSGRSALDSTGQQLLDELRANGAEALHLRADVSDDDDVQVAVQTILKHFGGLNTIIHSAGVLQDGYLRGKNGEQIQSVLAPKIAGVQALDRATESIKLDHFVLFSSLAGSLGNPGQADYAAANAYLDGFAVSRNHLVAVGQRHGQTLSIAWPLWQQGGMSMDRESQTAMQRSTGLMAMDNQTGIAAYQRAIQSALDHVLVTYGDATKIRSLLVPTTKLPSAKAPTKKETATELKSKLRAASAEAVPSASGPLLAQLIKLVAEQQDMDADLIDPDVELSQYGYDSIGFTALSNRLNRLFDLEILPTLFFEYSTLRALAQHLSDQVAVPAPVAETQPVAPAAKADHRPENPQALTLSPLKARRFRASVIQGESSRHAAQTDEPIAIIGMSGRFPGSASLEEFWQHLAAKRDLTSEVPSSRWNWRDCYGDPMQEPGKTWVKRGGFIADVDCFDPLFFGMAPDEAEVSDPQLRLFMETAWATIEDAGYAADRLAGSQTGVFVGVSNSDYQELLARSGIQAGSMEASQTFAFAIPNRISYLLDFHGPSEAIDTACSSSLVAVHRAVQSIRHGGCDLALAGGVNLMLTPSVTITGSRLGTLSRDGRCKTFDESADGYGRGEGVSAILLKPLSKALADGDCIHGLIRNSGENHGGKATSPSAPNPVAQADLLVSTYDEVGIDPSSLGYIEAHGTGTALGDPIEINGLKIAFAKLYEKQGLPKANSAHCVVGSVKANIGHLESAAGISGLIKVLLMLRHGKIPGNPHLHHTNPYLKLADSPMRLAQDTEVWQRLGENLPRRAGVSSFGVGGANAHVILEEYVDSSEHIDESDQRVLIVLSARTRERLPEMAQRLLTHLETNDGDSLVSIAWTLQTGRKAMRERLGFPASSRAELIAKLRGFVDGQDVAGLVSGRAGVQKSDYGQGESPDVLTIDAKKITQVTELQKILQHWAVGGAVDWNSLYAQRPRKTHLPTYPFARNRYWVDVDHPSNSRAVAGIERLGQMHPLVHQNVSNFDRQCYRSIFDGSEFFLSDHQVAGRKILPGVAYLEMARTALTDALDLAERAILIRNMVWAQPLVVEDQPRTVEILLQRESKGEIGFELSSKESAQVSTTHARGSACLVELDTPGQLDLDSLRNRCTHAISAEQCYQRFTELGFEYGPGLQGIQQVFVGSKQVLAKLSLPHANGLKNGSEKSLLLHPAIMDSALQASIGLIIHSSESNSDAIPLPFALDALEIYGPCPAEAWAYLRSSQAGGDLVKFDIDIADAKGKICVRLRGLSSRMMAAEPACDLLLCRPVWQDDMLQTPADPADIDARYVVLCQLDQVENLQLPESVSVLKLHSAAQSLSERFEALAVQSFELIRDLLKTAPTRRTLVQWVLPSTGENLVLQALSGLLKSASRENPVLINQLILLDEQQDADSIQEKLEQSTRLGSLDLLRYRGDRLQSLNWQEIPDDKTLSPIPWKEKGVYLITGGVGGLGRLIAEEIVAQIPATLILVGRSALDSAQQEYLAKLAQQACRVEYRKVDVNNRAQVEALIGWIDDELGPLSGVIHAAGEIRDEFISRKHSDEFRAVLRPKVTGSWNLDQATAELPLDFFLMFSSIAAVWGNAGQSDYAAANAFMDAFAEHRNQQRDHGERQGVTISVNWPLWDQGGMRLDDAAIALMRESTGLVPLDSELGIKALRRILSLNHPQVMVLSGDADKLRTHLNGGSKPTQAVAAPAPKSDEAVTGEDDLSARTIDYLRHFLATALKLPVDEVQADELFEQYGIDSVRVMQLTNDLEAIFGSLSKTLFFEYQTLEELSGYFLKAHGERLRELLKEKAKKDQPEEVSAPRSTSALHIASPAKRVETPEPATKPVKTEAIAIIGLAGRYPQSPDLSSFWENLKQGRDCISEIPASRWDWRAFFNEDGGPLGGHRSKWGGFIDEIDCFDPMFFNISPLEAEFMDPQERLFIEAAWHAMEDAGYSRQTLDPTAADDLPGQVGVYAGLMYSEYQLYAAESSARGKPMALSGSYAGLANRVSFILNLHGPSMTVDTMCSSSLTCLHLACQDLKLGRTNMAIAGGVNLSLHPNKYTMLSGGRMISTRGRCESFGEGGEGYIPSEGVGVAILKRLSDAERDGDSIYGVIKGSALNHGGKTNGYSVPNPNAQQMAINRALNEAGIDPRKVSYVEAHGTGTKLGDPIEITGLNKAFHPSDDKQVIKTDSGLKEDNPPCWVGSVKSNIGHCEAAAGIAGVTKVLLQMKHGQIVPSLHSQVLNPHIDFADSPFVVNQQLRDWQRPQVDGRTVARVAGISSFGAGGSNAHMVIEEYVRSERPEYAKDEPQLILLSARDEARLQDLIRSMLAFVRNHPDTALAEMAYTLQVGREALQERLALVVTSLAELQHQLQSLLDGKEHLEGLHRGSSTERSAALSQFADEELKRATLKRWLANKALPQLADVWVKGVNLDWAELHGENHPLRISLPGYPFARERYWAPDSQAISPELGPSQPKQGKVEAAGTVINDQFDTSLKLTSDDPSGQSYSTLLTGDEFFLTDHQVRGQKVLPAVVYLELARAAAEQSATGNSNEPLGIALRNLVWARPIVVQDQPTQVQIALNANTNGELAFQIQSHAHGNSTEAPVLHSRGVARRVQTVEAPRLDLAALQSKINGQALQAEQCYELFSKAGIAYGPAHQGLKSVYSKQGEVLAKLSLPACVSDTRQNFVLHPSLMDSALQACIGLSLGEGEAGGSLTKPALPFALDELQIHAACSEDMWVWIRPATSVDSNSAGKLDLDLCDHQGQLAVSMRGLAFRTLTDADPTSNSTERDEVLLGRPIWRQQASSQQIHGPEFKHHYVLLCDWSNSEAADLQLSDDVLRVHLQALDGPLDLRFRDLSSQMFKLIRQLLQQHSVDKTLLQVLVPNRGDKINYIGLSGLLKTAQLENPNIKGQLILTDPQVFASSHANNDFLLDNARSSDDALIRYRAGVREVLSWDQLTPAQTTVSPWKEGGVYLVTGGAGGIGAIVAREIARQSNKAVLVLTGRSPLSPNISSLIAELEKLGARAEYRQTDVVQAQEVKALVDEVIQNYGALHGVLHAAGITDDSYLLKKDGKDFDTVLSPKVSGAINLDQATSHLDLDFLLLFSSLAGVTGNPGQCDYATANGFMDAFASYRNGLVAAGERKGQTLSINWPLWGEGGMRVDGNTEKLMRDRTGMVPLETKAALTALADAMVSGESQVSVMQGDISRLATVFHTASTQHSAEAINHRVAAVTTEKVQANSQSPSELQDKAVAYFKTLLSSKMKIPIERIRASEPLQQYGMDSIIAMNLVAELEQHFGSLPQTLFFEYQSIEDLSRYFSEQHCTAFRDLIGYVETPTPATNKSALEVSAEQALDSANANHGQVSSTDIAVIGLCGRYPLAANLDEYWNNLREGRDCITEIPPERWDHDLYFDPDRNKLGKTYSKWGGFIQDVDQFDSLFFNISPHEAEVMDPQQRLFLQTVWELLEGAGYTRETIREQFERKVGVFVGAMYQPYQAFDSDLVRESVISLTSYASIANRVSYFFDFQGPSMAVDTMCSSSLMAIQMACESLLKGDARMAVAGGVNLSIHPKKYIGLSAGQMIGSSSTSRSFAQGDGYLPAEGVGAILLKPLAQAIEDGDEIHAVIKSVAANHGGATHGFHLPNMDAQVRLIEENFRKSDINPRSISYVESAANGSALGDPIEVRALTKAFQKFTNDRDFCAIGSVKSNIGHAEAASGISQLTKVILQLRHKQLVPTVMQGPLNPQIAFADSPFHLQQELEEWKRPAITQDGERKEFPRRATVSSFGAGGSNAHIILEEYSPTSQPLVIDQQSETQLLVLSARSLERLKVSAKNLAEYLRDHPDVSLMNLAYTLQVGREAMNDRLAIVVDDLPQAIQDLQHFVAAANKDMARDLPSNLFYSGAGEDETSSPDSLLSDLLTGLDKHWPTKNQLETLAQQWVKGAWLDWTKLYRHRTVRRVALPTYPFERKRHWLGDVVLMSDLPQDEPVVVTAASNVRDSVLKFIAQLSGLETKDIDINGRLAEFGADSLIRLRLLNHINADWGTNFDVALMAGDKTLRELIADIEVVLEDKDLANKNSLSDEHKQNSQQPSFIQAIEWPLQAREHQLEPKQRDAALQTLGNLCAEGVGVWRDGQRLCFQFFKQTQDELSLQHLVSEPEALAAVLEPGKRYYPTSHVQQMALHETEVNKKGTFNLLQGFWMDAPVDVQHLNQALNDLAADHSIFRTEAKQINGTWLQVVYDQVQLECQEVTWPEISDRNEFEQVLQEFQEHCSAQLHDIDDGPLFDLYLIHNEAKLAAVLFHTHHFHVDGFSFFAFQRELLLRYQSIANQQPWPMQKPQTEYAHFALSQFDPANEAHTQFWAERFADTDLEMGLQDRRRYLNRVIVPDDAWAGGRLKAGFLQTKVSAERLNVLQQFNQENDTTLTQLISCAWFILSWRISGENLPVQMVNNLRDRIEFETVMGDFSSSLPMLLNLNSSSSVQDVLNAYQQAMLDLQRHKRCNLPELRRRLGMHQHGVINAVAIDSNDRDSLVDTTGFVDRIIPIKPEGRDPVGQLLILVEKTDQQMSLSYLYDRNRFSARSMELIVEAMDALLVNMIENPQRLIRNLALPMGLRKRLKLMYRVN